MGPEVPNWDWESWRIGNAISLVLPDVSIAGLTNGGPNAVWGIASTEQNSKEKRWS